MSSNVTSVSNSRQGKSFIKAAISLLKYVRVKKINVKDVDRFFTEVLNNLKKNSND